MFWGCPGVSYQLDVPGKPPRGSAKEASRLDAWTTSTGSFQCEGAALRAPSGCLLTLSLRVSAATPWRELISAAWIRILLFQSLPIGKGWDIDWLVNRQLCLLAQLSLHHAFLLVTSDATPSCSKTPRYLNSFAWGSSSLRNPGGAIHRFPAGNHGLRFRGAATINSHSKCIYHSKCIQHTVSRLKVFWGLMENHYFSSDRLVFPLRFSGEWPDMMHRLFYRRFTSCTHVTCSFSSKALADCQCSTRSCFSGVPCPCQGSKQAVKTSYAGQRVWPSLGGRGWRKRCEERKLLRRSGDVCEDPAPLSGFQPSTLPFQSNIIRVNLQKFGLIRMDINRKTLYNFISQVIQHKQRFVKRVWPS